MTSAQRSPVFLKWNRYLLRITNSTIRILVHLRRMLQIKIYLKEFDYRDDDIYIITYMKSGTTLLQMMLYQMLTDGNMDFDHIYDVSPWLEQSIDLGKSLAAVPSPRVMKSHAEYKYFPKRTKGKIIYCIRDGMDVAVSMFHHYKNLETSDLEWNDFLTRVFAKESWFEHVRDWLDNSNHYNIHYIHYEELTQHPGKAVEGLAGFLGIRLTDEAMQRTIQRCSFAFMKENEGKFGARRPTDKRRFDQFIRKGESYKGRLEFNEEQKRWYKDQYAKNLSKYKLKYDNGIAGN